MFCYHAHMEPVDSNPLITVIIPVYNAEKYLRCGLDSLLAQTCGDWEAVCVDDGSTDGSAAVLEEYARRDSRFRVLRQENSGVSVARNRGIQEARGEWVTFLDADDWLSEDILQALLPHTRRESVDVIGFEAEVKFEDGIEHIEGLEQGFRLNREGEYPSLPENVNYMIGTCWGKVYRRDFLLENAITFPLGMRQEDEVFYRCAMGAARNMYLLKRTGYCYYQNAASYMHVTLNPENCYLLYLKGADIIHGFYRKLNLGLEWDETLLGLLHYHLFRLAGDLSPETLDRFRKETTDFLRKARLDRKFPHDRRLAYLSYAPWWKRMFIQKKRREVMYGIFGMPLCKDCYTIEDFALRVTPWSKIKRLFRQLSSSRAQH